MSKPVDEQLYNKIKNEVDKSYDKPSAYRSMAYTRAYIAAFKEKYGASKKPYTGKKPGELQTWRNEKWVDIKSLVKDPKNPVACGNMPYGKDEYPLCMPVKQAQKYSKGELELLLKRKSELKDRRLVKDAYLRDVLKPKEIPPARIYKQKYKEDRRIELPKPVSETKAKEILKEKPIKVEVKKEAEEVEKPEPKKRGRPPKPEGAPRYQRPSRAVEGAIQGRPIKLSFADFTREEEEAYRTIQRDKALREKRQKMEARSERMTARMRPANVMRRQQRAEARAALRGNLPALPEEGVEIAFN